MLSTTRFFFDVLPTSVTKCSFFFDSSLMLTSLVFFKPPYDECSEITRFFLKCAKIKWKNAGKSLENYQKIPEKSNSCFLMSKNSFRVFRGSFDKFFYYRRKLAHLLPVSPNNSARWRKWKVFKFSKLFF